MARPIVFLTDYGLEDEFAGVCRAVVARIAPEVAVLDLTHAIPPQDVLTGALTLGRAAPYLPSDAVVLAVVDPGVGTERRAIVVETHRGPVLVGPDNGLLSLAWIALGGLAGAYEVEDPKLLLEPVSATFHGRDVFAPVAARLASGEVEPAQVGRQVAAESLEKVHVPAPTVVRGGVSAKVLGVDRFGNVELNLREQHLVALGITDAITTGPFTLKRVRAFADLAPGALAFLVDSSGWVALVASGGSAAVALGLAPGDSVMLGPPRPPGDG
jgi:S-adenosylmethionine hydrolase